MNRVYQNPKYYEIAFSYRDSRAEVDVFEQAIRQYSQIPVTKMLELGCGIAPHLAELARRKYQYIGLDLSPAMLEYSQRKADAIKASASFILANMTDFGYKDQVDFVFILLGSLAARNTAELAVHFDSVSRVLKPGGLYFLDWCVEFAPGTASQETWEMESDQIRVKTTYQSTLINPIEQIFEESLSLEVEDEGVKQVFQETGRVHKFYPQEFLLFVSARSDFEFIGWWNNWDLSQPLGDSLKISRPITILRRT
jgi:SAM-dependent methyltransferase